MRRNATLRLLFLGFMVLAGCTAGNFTSSTQPPTISLVTVSCVPASIQPSQTSQCAATVTGTGSYSSGVTWSAVSGTITGSGSLHGACNRAWIRGRHS